MIEECRVRTPAREMGIIEEDHYYAFGLKIAGISSKKLGDPNEGLLDNKNLYNDKELFDDADLDWYDYGFRNYDPQIGRFTQLDPLTDEYPFYTPYQYSGNEPIANTDIDGLEPVPSNLANDFFKVSGKVEEKTLQSVVLVGLSKAAPAANAGINIFKLSTRAIPLLTNIAAAHSEQSVIKNQIQASINYQTSPSEIPDGPTISQCCNYYVSDQQKAQYAQQTSDAGYNPDGTLNFSGRLAQNKTWSNFADNIVFSPGADVAGLIIGVGELRGSLRFAKAALEGVEYTKSSLSLGRRMHTLYKAGLADNVTTFKEFTKVKGIRPDFVDFSTKTIHELKPYNPRGLKEGANQLKKYQKLFERKYGGDWKTVLDVY